MNNDRFIELTVCLIFYEGEEQKPDFILQFEHGKDIDICTYDDGAGDLACLSNIHIDKNDILYVAPDLGGPEYDNMATEGTRIITKSNKVLLSSEPYDEVLKKINMCEK